MKKIIDPSVLGVFALLTAQLLAAGVGLAAESGVAVVKEPAPAADISADVAKALSPTGHRITADGKVVAEVWLTKQWPIKAKFSPSLSVLYPFEPGELIGVIRYPKRGADFRDQQFKSGVYTLRYGLQPQDGNHVGTSDTRDFLMLLPAKKDAKPARVASIESLFGLSTQVSQSTHPAILSMLMVPDEAKSPAVRHIEDREFWSVRLTGQGKAGEKTKALPIEFVIIGHGEE